MALSLMMSAAACLPKMLYGSCGVPPKTAA